MNFFCIAGALNAGYVCDRFGRRHTFTISCAIFIAGILIQVREEGRKEGGEKEWLSPRIVCEEMDGKEAGSSNAER